MVPRFSFHGTFVPATSGASLQPPSDSSGMQIIYFSLYWLQWASVATFSGPPLQLRSYFSYLRRIEVCVISCNFSFSRNCSSHQWILVAAYRDVCYSLQRTFVPTCHGSSFQPPLNSSYLTRIEVCVIPCGFSFFFSETVPATSGPSFQSQVYPHSSLRWSLVAVSIGPSFQLQVALHSSFQWRLIATSTGLFGNANHLLFFVLAPVGLCCSLQWATITASIVLPVSQANRGLCYFL